jgi:hypothetical protein
MCMFCGWLCVYLLIMHTRVWCYGCILLLHSTPGALAWASAGILQLGAAGQHAWAAVQHGAVRQCLVM